MKNLLSFFILSILLCAAVSCKPDRKREAPAGAVGQPDSTEQFRLALVPDAEAFPFYYAERAGFYDSLGLNVQIESYRSQMDCDTALLSGRVNGGLADVVRWKSYGRRTEGMLRVAQGERAWQLVTSGSLRIRKMANLKGRMVVIARQSGEYEVLTDMVKSAGMKLSDIYRPQINDLRLRAFMLTDNQVDAAMLCWPYTSLALSAGHRHVAEGKGSNKSCWLVECRKSHADKKTKVAWDLLNKGYLMAKDSLQHPDRKIVAQILRSDYGLPADVADTVKIPLRNSLRWETNR